MKYFYFNLVGSLIEEHTSLYNIRVVFFQDESKAWGIYFSCLLYEFKSLSQQTTYQNRKNYMDMLVIRVVIHF